MVIYNRYKRVVGWIAAAVLMTINFTPWAQSIRVLPDTIGLMTGESVTYSWSLPVEASFDGDSVAALSDQSQTLRDVNSRSITVSSDSAMTGTVTLKLFGVIPVKTIGVRVYESRTLIPGGGVVGVTLKTDGVLVVGMSPVLTKTGNTVSPVQDSGLKSGDYILAVNGHDVKSVSDLVKLVDEAKGARVLLKIRRGQEIFSISAAAAEDASGIYKLGIWARDSTAGVGTLSYYDPGSGNYGALGHPITDADSGVLLSVQSGKLYSADVLGVKKGEKGTPGELRGVFSADDACIGTLSSNTMQGIFGTCQASAVESMYPQGLPIAARSSIKTGYAQILSTVDANGIQEYDCEILQVFEQTANSTKSMMIRITDPELLAVTGGIVQGMSGSPIIQDGKLVGAVTHVLVNDPTRGYGIFVENMLEAAS